MSKVSGNPEKVSPYIGQVYGDQIKFVDNPFFPMSPRAKEYHEQVAAMSEKDYKRYFLGEWECQPESIT